MKKVAIIGASGMAGSAIYKLAQKEPSLEATGIVRNQEKAEEILGADANLLLGNVLEMANEMLEDFDVIIDAFGTSPNRAGDQITLAQKLVKIAQRNNARVIFILGAGSLHTGKDNHLVIDDIAKQADSEAWINTPRQQLKELEFLNDVDDVDWLGISPAMTFEAGPLDEYELGKDQLLYNDQHESKVTADTMAELVISEAVDPFYHQERITIVNK